MTSFRSAMSAANPQFRCAGKVRDRRIGVFIRDDDGSLIIFSLFMIVVMLIAVGVGVDTMRYEAKRTHYQNTADRAVLAAADLDVAKDPNRDPQDVVAEYFRRSGIPSDAAKVTVTPGPSGNVVSVETEVKVPTLLLKLIGVNTLTGPAPSTATETINDVEVVLVLDNSGSMGAGTKMNDLKAAARQFVDDVVRDDTGFGTVAVSIVPFATQVNPGSMGARYNLTAEHGYSNCVSFADSDYTSAAMSPQKPFQRTGHFEPVTESKGPRPLDMVCPTVAEREITPWSTDRAHLKSRIDAMVPYGWTSIEMGTKWGLAMLDPAARPIVNDLIASGEAPNDVQGMPFDYSRPNTAKYLIVMSDGANTTHWDVKPAYRAGPSPVWKDGGEYYYQNPDDLLFYSEKNGKSVAGLGTSAVNLAWPEVWAEMTVKFFANRLARRALGGNWWRYYNEVVASNGSGGKNVNTSKICAAARDAKVTVFTIGVGTYGQGDATLEDCAGGTTNFFDIDPDELDEAFGAIARQINQLRLTQ